MTPDQLKHYWVTEDLQIREEGGDAPPVLSGTVFRYGDTAVVPYKGGAIRERIAPQAIKGDISKLDITANLQHDRARSLARTGYGLVLIPTATELRAELTLGDDTDSRDTLSKFKRGILRGFSGEFYALRSRMEGNVLLREEIVLDGLAVVDRPAYHDSVLESRALEIVQLTPAVATFNVWR